VSRTSSGRKGTRERWRSIASSFATRSRETTARGRFAGRRLLLRVPDAAAGTRSSVRRSERLERREGSGADRHPHGNPTPHVGGVRRHRCPSREPNRERRTRRSDSRFGCVGLPSCSTPVAQASDIAPDPKHSSCRDSRRSTVYPRRPRRSWRATASSSSTSGGIC
jgi:hypothetical protein